MEAKLKGPLTGYTIAFDLDDTLLISSWTGAHHWGDLANAPLISSWQRTSPEYILRRLSKSGLSEITRQIINRVSILQRFNAPVVEVAFRSGAPQLLYRLRKLGAELALITASSRERVDYLFGRMPWLASLFTQCDGKLNVATADEIIPCLRRLNVGHTTAVSANGTVMQGSSRMHGSVIPSIALKTPLLARELFGNEYGYDILVDDNLETRDHFHAYNLHHCLITVDGSAPHGSPIFSQLLDQICSRLNLTTPPPMADGSVLECNGGSSVVRIEDPFYLRSIRRTLSLSECE